MDLIPLLLLFTVIWKISCVKPITATDENYIRKDSCTALRGLFALIIMIGHIRQQTGSGYLMRIFDCTGHLAAAFFFFLSGYGLLKSIEKDDGYIKSFPKKKLQTIIIPYITVCIVYWIASYFPWGEKLTPVEFLNSFINGNPVAAHSWYVIELIILYFAFYILAIIFKKNKKIIAVALTLICVVLVYGFKKLDYGNWWGNSSFGFVAGLFWELYEGQINRATKKPSVFTPVFLACAFAWCLTFAIALKYFNSGSEIAFHIIRFNAALFPVLVMLLRMKIIIASPVLKFIGTISFEFYMIHGLAIEVCRNLLSPFLSDISWSLCAIALTAGLAFLLHKLFDYIKQVKPC